mmetsp:Transcript_24590/g.54901  ORF Transcript_24590/g.54901 Transcript_24590/m.54901 type:complete len:192 (+) Transcript_24590:82-657(+)
MYFSKFVLRRCAIRSFPGKPAGQRVGRVPDHSSKSRGRARRGCTESRNAQRKPNTRRPAMLSRHRSGKCQKRGASRRVIERIAGCTCRTTAAVVRITVGPTESVFLMVRSPDLALCLKALLLGIATSHRSSSSSSSNKRYQSTRIQARIIVVVANWQQSPLLAAVRLNAQSAGAVGVHCTTGLFASSSFEH